MYTSARNIRIQLKELLQKILMVTGVIALIYILVAAIERMLKART